MSYVASASLARQLGSLFEGGSVAGLSDRQLLERFTARGEPADEAAFAAIVARHGPMVLGVCRQLLGDHHHAEDAFQAVFLVLARQARSIRDPDLLGTWLYGVALRTARKARGRLARRRRTEEEGAARQAEARSRRSAEQALIDREQAEALHREIDRLPGAFRVPVVLCYFEGLTLDEAAHRLRWPAGTLRSRLARAREKLRRGLTRRGVALSTTALAAALAPRSASASVSSLLCDTTTRAAIALRGPSRRRRGPLGPGRGPGPGGPPYHADPQAEGSPRSPCCSWPPSPPARAVSTPLAGDPGRTSLAGEPLADGSDGASPCRGRPRCGQRPAPGRMTVVGRVLDPQGKPVPNASVMVYGAIKQAGRRGRRAMRTRTARPGDLRRLGPVSGSTCRGSRRRRITWSVPRPSRRDSAWAGSTWTSTPTSPPPTSRSGPSR